MDDDCLFQHVEVGKTDGHSPNFLVKLLGRFNGDCVYQMYVSPITKEKVLGSTFGAG